MKFLRPERVTTIEAEVSVVEFAGRAPARAVPADVAADVVAKHHEHGVEFRWGAR